MRYGFKHGLSKTKEYKAWQNMKDRCLNKNSFGYKNYGARGITVYDRWLKFENFYKDMGKAPAPQYSIDRIDNNGNYEPKNCKWAVNLEQQGNKRRNILITHKGETHTIHYWAKNFNKITGSLYYYRKKQKWTDKQIISYLQ